VPSRRPRSDRLSKAGDLADRDGAAGTSTSGNGNDAWKSLAMPKRVRWLREAGPGNL